MQNKFKMHKLYLFFHFDNDFTDYTENELVSCSGYPPNPSKNNIKVQVY